MRNPRTYISLLVFLSACGGGFGEPVHQELPYDPTQPPTAGDRPVTPYTGADPYVLDAQARMRTGLDLHRKVIQRSCSGAEGVCHNRTEYPDMRTPESFLSIVNSPCNASPKDHFTIYDRCERAGDRVSIDGGPGGELAWVNWIRGESPTYGDGAPAPDEESIGLHLAVQGELSDRPSPFWGTLDVTRSLASGSGSFVLARVQTRWWKLDDGHLFGEVPEGRVEGVEAFLRSGLIQGDANRNGTYGAATYGSLSLISPADPEGSYLIGRLRGRLLGEIVPGTRMPLANLPPTIPDMLALLCFIEGLPDDGSVLTLEWAINYSDCSYIADPAALDLTGGGTSSFSGRIRPLLEANCVGCHSGGAPSAGLDFSPDGLHARIVNVPSTQRPSVRLVQPGNTGASYLWQKLIQDPAIEGLGMPQSPEGYRRLTDEELADIELWILSGALED